MLWPVRGIRIWCQTASAVIVLSVIQVSRDVLLCSPVNIYPHFRDASLFSNTEHIDFISTALKKRQMLRHLLMCRIKQPDSQTCHPPPQHTSLPLPRSPYLLGHCITLSAFLLLFIFIFFVSLFSFFSLPDHLPVEHPNVYLASKVL